MRPLISRGTNAKYKLSDLLMRYAEYINEPTWSSLANRAQRGSSFTFPGVKGNLWFFPNGGAPGVLGRPPPQRMTGFTSVIQVFTALAKPKTFANSEVA